VLDSSDEELAGRIGLWTELHHEHALRWERDIGRCDGAMPDPLVSHGTPDTALASGMSVRNCSKFRKFSA